MVTRRNNTRRNSAGGDGASRILFGQLLGRRSHNDRSHEFTLDYDLQTGGWYGGGNVSSDAPTPPWSAFIGPGSVDCHGEITIDFEWQYMDLTSPPEYVILKVESEAEWMEYGTGSGSCGND